MLIIEQEKLTLSPKWIIGIIHFFLLGAELGSKKALIHYLFLRGGIIYLLRNHKRSSWNCR